jgi:Family of unknown function (DUF695)
MKFAQMCNFFPVFLICSINILGKPVMGKDTEDIGLIGRTVENGRPVIWRFWNKMPDPEKRAKLPWLTVISWKYDGAANNGMPSKAINDQMIKFEDTLEKKVEKEDFCEHANSRTGNNLKEFVFYIQNQEAFMERFNSALIDQPTYPIEIVFYNDPDWKEFAQLLKDFANAKDKRPKEKRIKKKK